MKSYHAESGGGLASLVARSHPVPQPGPREVLVRVRANSLNARELSVLAGTYPLPVKPDVVMCADDAGEIVAAGQDVRRWAMGAFRYYESGQMFGKVVISHTQEAR